MAARPVPRCRWEAGGAAGPDAEPDMMLCGGLLAECWEKIVELTAAYDIDITQPKQVR